MLISSFRIFHFAYPYTHKTNFPNTHSNRAKTVLTHSGDPPDATQVQFTPFECLFPVFEFFIFPILIHRKPTFPNTLSNRAKTVLTHSGDPPDATQVQFTPFECLFPVFEFFIFPILIHRKPTFPNTHSNRAKTVLTHSKDPPDATQVQFTPFECLFPVFELFILPMLIHRKPTFPNTHSNRAKTVLTHSKDPPDATQVQFTPFECLFPVFELFILPMLIHRKPTFPNTHSNRVKTVLTHSKDPPDATQVQFTPFECLFPVFEFFILPMLIHRKPTFPNTHSNRAKTVLTHSKDPPDATQVQFTPFECLFPVFELFILPMLIHRKPTFPNTHSNRAKTVLTHSKDPPDATQVQFTPFECLFPVFELFILPMLIHRKPTFPNTHSNRVKTVLTHSKDPPDATQVQFTPFECLFPVFELFILPMLIHRKPTFPNTHSNRVKTVLTHSKDPPDATQVQFTPFECLFPVFEFFILPMLIHRKPTFPNTHSNRAKTVLTHSKDPPDATQVQFTPFECLFPVFEFFILPMLIHRKPTFPNTHSNRAKTVLTHSKDPPDATQVQFPPFECLFPVFEFFILPMLIHRKPTFPNTHSNRAKTVLTHSKDPPDA